MTLVNAHTTRMTESKNISEYRMPSHTSYATAHCFTRGLIFSTAALSVCSSCSFCFSSSSC